MSARREKIEAMLKLEPQDQFLRYGLAAELRSEDRLEESLAVYRGLMADPQPHVPSFLMAAQLLVELDRIAEARAALRDGIEIARQEGEAHAAGEMSELLASLGSLGE
jgi:hypothetical protein